MTTSSLYCKPDLPALPNRKCNSPRAVAYRSSLEGPCSSPRQPKVVPVEHMSSFETLKATCLDHMIFLTGTGDPGVRAPCRHHEQEHMSMVLGRRERHWFSKVDTLLPNDRSSPARLYGLWLNPSRSILCIRPHPFGRPRPWFQRGNEARDTNPPVGADILGLQMPRPR